MQCVKHVVLQEVASSNLIDDTQYSWENSFKRVTFIFLFVRHIVII